MHTNLPNLLIVGAAKSGTTSLHNYLNQHPEVFMPKVKEPKFFSSKVVSFPFKGRGDDLVEREISKDLKSYKKLFEKHEDQYIIGDSSADNLYYSSKVIPHIKKTLGKETKIIIVLRNPVERAFSAFMHLKRDNREYLENFSDALSEEENRIRDNFEFIWHYKRAGLYSNDVKNYLDNFKNVKVILSEEIHKDIENQMKEICEFLEINSEFQFSTLQQFNSSGKVKNRLIQNIFSSRLPLKRKIGRIFPKSFKNKIKSRNIVKVEIPLKDKGFLLTYFKNDIIDLQRLINKNLSNWLK